MVYRWNVPDDIEKEVQLESLSHSILFYYHDQMHIFWERILEGRYFGQSSDDGWTFNDIYNLHKKTVLEIMKRGLIHINPINSLDDVPFAKNRKSLMDLINSIKK